MSSSVNEELQPKHRLSPFELRNTDLVSRLLAATPPYLYNMPLVPHSYFFSEMLRSLVQNKVDAAARMSNNIPHRRPRKRTWTQCRAETYQKEERKIDQEMPPPIWTPPKIEKRHHFEKPLELTINKIPLNNNTKVDLTNEASTSRIQDFQNLHHSPSTITSHTSQEKQDIFYPTVPITSPDQSTSSSASSTDLILPPPPPIWYPPIYPPPYGIDPLHFFIDLRVSGHIYDRKNQKEESPQPPTPTETSSSQVSPPTVPEINFPLSREPRHCSAFSVPVPSNLDPLNLTSKLKDDRNRKFDIKSMGFDTSENKRSSNYVLKNLVKIYSHVDDAKVQQEEHGIDLTSKEVVEEKKEEEMTEEEKEKKCKDLRALIGLELVVDYVNHNVKPKCVSEESSTDLDSRCSSASTVEIVSIPDM